MQFQEGEAVSVCSANDHLDDLEQDIQLIWASNFPSTKRKGVQIFDLN